MKSTIKKALIFSVLVLAALMLIILFRLTGESYNIATASTGNGTQFVIEKNPIVSVEIASASRTQLKRGDNVKLSCRIFPETANETVEDISYEIIAGDRFASIQGDTLTVNRDAKIGAKIEVKAVVDGVNSHNNLMFYVVETPIESIEIIALSDVIYQGGVMHLGTDIYPNDATDKEITYSITDGKEYADINFNGTIAVSKNLPAGDLSITVRAESTKQPSVFAEKIFKLYKPVIGITSANSDLKEVEQKRTYSFKANAEPFNATFGDRPVTYSVNVPDYIATISTDGMLSVFEGAPVGQDIVVRIDAADGIYYEQTVTVVPVYATGFAIKDYTEPNELGGYLPGSTIDIEAEFFGADNISEINKDYKLQISNDKYARVDGHSIIIKNIQEITDVNPKFTVRAFTMQNGVELSDKIEISIFIPVTSIELTAKTDWVYQGASYYIEELLSTSIFPQNSAVRVAEYELFVAGNVAYFDGDRFVITDDVPLGNMQVQIKAKVFDVESDIITFNIYKPTHNLAVNVSEYEPISSKEYGEKVYLTTFTDETATANNPKIKILKGAENIVGNYNDGDLLSTKEFDICSNLAYQSNFNPLIVLELEQDGISTQTTLEVYIPNEDILISIKNNELNRGELNAYTVSNTPNANEKRFEIIEFSEEYIEEIDTKGQTIKISQKAPAGTKITLKYRSLDKLQSDFKAEFIVKRIITSDTETDLKYSDTPKIYKSGHLYFEFNKDSEWNKITQNYRQLHVGYSATCTVNYGGYSLADFGMSLENVVPTSDNIEIKRFTNDSFTIKVKDDADGRSLINEIWMEIRIKDGSVSQPFNLEPLQVFRPMTGTPTLKGSSVIVEDSTQLGFYTGSFDTSATYSLSNLEFSCSEVGQNGADTGVNITTKGWLTINEKCSFKELSIKATCEQIYNGKPITYSRSYDKKVRWIKLKDTLRNEEKEVLGVGNFSSHINPPECKGYTFGGYYTSTGGWGAQYYDNNGDKKVSHSGYSGYTELYAKWSYTLKDGYQTGSKVTIQEEKTKTAVWDVTEYWYLPDDVEGFMYWTLTGQNLGSEKHISFKNANVNGDGYALLLAVYEESSSCVVQGTLITLADGTQKAVEDLDGTEQVLAWDFTTSKFVSTPLIFVVNHGEDEYEVIHLQFSDGTEVGIIYEHGFFDYDLNKYVFLRNDAEKYIGHSFNKQSVNEQGKLINKKVKLINVTVEMETTVSYSPLASEYMCYYVNGMLSASAETEAFVNMFDFDCDNMVYASTLEEDIKQYGLFTYDDFKDLVSEEIFEAFNGKYLKIAIGKGLITWDKLVALISQYSEYLSE